MLKFLTVVAVVGVVGYHLGKNHKKVVAEMKVLGDDASRLLAKGREYIHQQVSNAVE